MREERCMAVEVNQTIENNPFSSFPLSLQLGQPNRDRFFNGVTGPTPSTPFRLPLSPPYIYIYIGLHH